MSFFVCLHRSICGPRWHGVFGLYVRLCVRASGQGHSRPACRRHLVFFADESPSLCVLVVSLLFHEDLAVSRACVGSQRRAMGDSRLPYGLAVRHCRLRPDGDAVALRHSSTALENQRRGVVSTRLQHVFQHSIERVQQLKKRKKHVFSILKKTSKNARTFSARPLNHPGL